MRTGEELLLQVAEEVGIKLAEEQVKKLLIYKDLLKTWNKKFNLTAITDEQGVVIKHFIDSLLSIKAVDFPPRAKVVDVGTGAGFPGIPLKIWEPRLFLVLVDASKKRITFLQAVINQLELEEVKAVHARAEDLGQERGFREEFDTAVARAVAPLNVLAEYCLPLVRLNGVFLALKGPEGEIELKQAETALEELGGKVEKVERCILPRMREKRTLIVVRKVLKTPEKFPRRAGIPAKRPL
ncbi:16S rRNA (guanine(527)-N(7))-methyltransferase RsmG [Calderihabitans maritimus]|uniref:Ribosomal RNA small subunit methyltransferase G n=1 Tax=Calderihabitans maritimus TaxID=1246530 RepID=A0A1Z5HVV5_9FIRM|nr:16S rRNA (guanine(527)-N(7))-methyltransferase RsmG [Calderihabitans maritimus]GAW93654.1 rRNA small subunit methyltransferase [Calderihabitans maritimus]